MVDTQVIMSMDFVALRIYVHGDLTLAPTVAKVHHTSLIPKVCSQRYSTDVILTQTNSNDVTV